MQLPKRIPTSVFEAVALLQICASDADREAILKMDHPGEMHHGFGMFLRNYWSLWKDESELRDDFKDLYGLWGMADDVSGIILHAWCLTEYGSSGKIIDSVLAKEVESFKKHWQRYGIDPATGKKIS